MRSLSAEPDAARRRGGATAGTSVRRRPMPRRQAAALRTGGIALGSIAVFGLLAALWTSGTLTAAWRGIHGVAMDVTVAAGFSVQEVLVEGRRSVDGGAIMSALGVGRGDPIFDLDPDAAQTALLQIPWIRSASVERRLPDTIFVRVEERVPLALWQANQKFSLIDRDGHVLPVQSLADYPDLPMVVGADAAETAATLVDGLSKSPDIARRIRSAMRIGGRRWDLLLDNHVTVKLPDGDIGPALARLEEAQLKDSVLDRDVLTVDLRLADRMVLQLSPAAAAQRPQPKDKT
jgi:cell division protein FtsQ